MSKLNLRRIDCTVASGREQIAALRNEISALGDVVSPRSRRLTEQVFGEALPPVRVVERICTDVKTRGLAAVLHYT